MVVKTKFQRHHLFLILIFFCGCLCYGLTKDSNYPIKVRTIEGIKVIINPEYPRYGKTALKLKDVLVLGDDEDGDALISSPMSIQVDNNGNLYYLDRKLVCIKVFNKSGKYLRKIGRKGKGSGEFTLPANFVLHPDGKMILNDSRSRRITYFSSSGKILKEFRYDFNWRCNEMRDGFSKGFYVMREVSVLDKLGSRFKPREKDNFLYRYDIDKNRWYKLGVFSGEFFIAKTMNDGIMLVGGPYSVIWNVNSRGEIVVGLNERYQLDILSPRGKKLLRFGRGYKRKKNPSGKKEFLNQFFPAFGYNILFDEKGCIWVEQHLQKRKVKWTYDIFSSDGIYLKQVQAPYRFHCFNNGFVYGVDRSEDEDYLIKASIILSGLE